MLNYRDREKIEVGQQVYMHYYGYGRNKGRYSRPLEIIKVTKTQFTVEGETEDDKPKRFMLSTGNEVGRGYRSRVSLTLVTPESTKEVEAYNKKLDAEKTEKESAERQAEIKLRKKYGANKITDDEIQKRFLKPLRHQMEIGESIMEDFLGKFQGVSIEDENFYRVTDAVRREHETNKFEYGLQIRDKCDGLHQLLVSLILHFNHGTRYQIGKVECNDLTELLEARVRQVLGEQYDRFFNYTFGHKPDLEEADQQFITVLREILDDEFTTERVRVIDPDDDE